MFAEKNSNKNTTSPKDEGEYILKFKYFKFDPNKKREKKIHQEPKAPEVSAESSKQEKENTTLEKKTNLNNFEDTGTDSDSKIVLKSNFSGRPKKDPSKKIERKIKKSRRPRVYKYTPCEVCGKIVSGVKAHMMTHTGEKRFKCEFCFKAFAHLHDYKHHRYVHTGEKPYKCNHLNCLKAFAHYTSLKTHTVTHTKSRDHKCEICGKNYGHALVLKQHIRSHFDDRKFHCKECDRSFLSKQVLKNHMRTHTGERPFQCSTCFKRFTRQDNLKQHVRTHTKEKLYKCMVCDASYGYKKALDSHMKAHNITHQDYPSSSSSVLYNQPQQLEIVTEAQPMQQHIVLQPQDAILINDSILIQNNHS